MQLLAIGLATVIPLVTLLLIRALDLYQTGNFSTVLGCVAWGAIAFTCAYNINSTAYAFGWFGVWENVARFVAPPVEETLKALILFYLVRRPNFTYFVDGAIYGFAVGVGFAVVENYQYILSAPNAAFGTAIGRVISTNLIHACAAALTGICIGLSRFESGPRRWLVLLGGLAAAILLHGIFNNIVAIILGGPVLFIATLIALTAVALILVLIFHGLAQSRRWITDKLGTDDRVTMGEARIVRRIGDSHELLKPLREMFGDKKMIQIEELLATQARLGIKRAALDRLPDERTRRATQQDIDELSRRIDGQRRAIGAYIMLAVRQVTPVETSSVWDVLCSRIEEQNEAHLQGIHTNLYDSLSQHLAANQNGGSASMAVPDINPNSNSNIDPALPPVASVPTGLPPINVPASDARSPETGSLPPAPGALPKTTDLQDLDATVE